MSRIRQNARILDSVVKPAFADKLPSAHTFTAYYQMGSGEALELGVWNSLETAEQGAMPRLQHKATLFIHERDGRHNKAVQHAYRVRQGQRNYVKNPRTGIPEWVKPLKLDHLFSLPVDAFQPARPFDAFRDDPTGVDRTLVQS